MSIAPKTPLINDAAELDSTTAQTCREDSVERPSLRQRVGVGVMCLVVFFVSYVLIAGPIAAIHSKVPAKPVRDAIEVTYAPLVFIVKKDIRPLAPMIKWYFRLWR